MENFQLPVCDERESHLPSGDEPDRYSPIPGRKSRDFKRDVKTTYERIDNLLDINVHSPRKTKILIVAPIPKPTGKT